MISKICKILGIVFVSLAALYLIVAWIIIPFGGKWIVQNQAPQFINGQVSIKSIQFNPFNYRLHVKEVSVSDMNNVLLAGFDRLTVDVDVMSAFKDVKRVELVVLDGLNVNVVMGTGGNINLVKLIKQFGDRSVEIDDEKSAKVSNDIKEGSADADEENLSDSETKGISIVVIDQVRLINGNVSFADLAVTPAFATKMSQMDLTIANISTQSEAKPSITYRAQLDDKGEVTAEAMVMPLANPVVLEASVFLNNYAMKVVSPYVGKFAGRELDDGVLGLKLDYRIEDNQLTATHKLLIQKFTFGQKVDSPDALNLPFGLAIGLLEDPRGQINIVLPVKGDLTKPDFEYWPLLGQVARNFFLKIVTKPFAFLGSIIGSEDGTDELGFVKFLPGEAELNKDEIDKLKKLVKGLKSRPKVSLEVDGSYDPIVDWKEIKTRVFQKDFDELSKETTKGEDYIYAQLYERAFGMRAQWALIRDHRAKGETYDQKSLNEEMKNHLIENAQADKESMNTLANQRAQVVYDQLIALGFPEDRLSMGRAHEAQASMGYVPLEFTLTIYEELPSNP